MAESINMYSSYEEYKKAQIAKNNTANNLIENDKNKLFSGKNELETFLEGRTTRTDIIEEQKTYRWIRVNFASEFLKIKSRDIVKIKYIPTGEILETTFICYNKQGSYKNGSAENIKSYVGEDDKTCLCLMLEETQLKNEKIRFIRSLFPNTPYYEYQVWKRNELLIEVNNIDYEYSSIYF